MALETINPLSTTAWQNLEKHFEEVKDIDVRNIFHADPDRFSKFTIQFQDFLIDFSKNRATDKTMELLLELANELKLYDAISKMFAGDLINKTENRAVLHTALRSPKGKSVKLGNKNIVNDVHAVRVKMKKFVREVISGSHTGFSNKPFTDVVNIGIGGSDLGPKFVTEALTYYKNHLNTHYVSNVDGDYLNDLLSKLNPETTLFIIVSKTFTTDETMTNALVLKSWFLNKGCILDIERHFVAVTSNIKLAESFGITSENVFPMWDWVGGRYSLWSSVGLSIALSVGFKNFEALLDGAYEMDEHFKNEKLSRNIPVILALISIWYNNFFKSETEAVISYSQYLEKFPSFLQQLVMESNGKSVDRAGELVNYQTGNIIWGDAGTNAQHAFFQLIHQGTKLVPIDFIGFVKPLYENNRQHDKLMANLFSQVDALLAGRSKEEVLVSSVSEIEKPFKFFSGNKPSNLILINKLTPKNLGSLLALYEHKTFVQGVIWNIFSFDQFGVELGKQICSKIIGNNAIKTQKSALFFTNQILNFYNNNNK